MRKSSKVIAVVAMATMLIGVTACGKKEVVEENTQMNISLVSSMDGTNDIELLAMDGMVFNELTGEFIDESLEFKRPLCIMINNIDEAMPQSGISQADIIFEMQVEGGITRLMAVFKDYASVGKLGPIRSSRHYYVTKSEEFDALYGHVGWSPYAEAQIANDGVDNLNGLLALSTIMFYRDDSRVAPHNCYTDGEKTVEGIAYDEYRTEYVGALDKMFSFNLTEKDLEGGENASKITTAHNTYSDPWFEYNPEDGLYYRFQYGAEQIDVETNTQLVFKNVVVQFATHTPLPDNYCIDINWLGEGEGYYATNGKIIPITWRKNDIYGVTHYYNLDGSELKLNPGKTFVTIFDNNNKSGVTFE